MSWTCPACGRTFANENQWHSCGQFEISDHFVGKPEELQHERVESIFRVSPGVCEVRFRLTSLLDLDDELVEWLTESWDVAK